MAPRLHLMISLQTREGGLAVLVIFTLLVPGQMLFSVRWVSREAPP